MWGNYRQIKQHSDIQLILQRLKTAGWDEAAINGYLRQIMKYAQDRKSMIKEIYRAYDDTFLIGSTVYLALYRASRLTSREKITLVSA